MEFRYVAAALVLCLSSSTQAAPVSTPFSETSARSFHADEIAAFARGQIGVRQDCTALVEKALRHVGKSVDDLAPAQFLKYGKKISKPYPGDLIYYRDGGSGQEHIAVYMGKGRAIHGGWNGHETVEATMDVGSGPTYFIEVAR